MGDWTGYPRQTIFNIIGRALGSGIVFDAGIKVWLLSETAPDYGKAQPRP